MAGRKVRKPGIVSKLTNGEEQRAANCDRMRIRGSSDGRVSGGCGARGNLHGQRSGEDAVARGREGADLRAGPGTGAGTRAEVGAAAIYAEFRGGDPCGRDRKSVV